MNCQHPDDIPGENADEIYRNLCWACRKKALSSMSTGELMGLEKTAGKVNMELMLNLRMKLPMLLNTELILSKVISDPSQSEAIRANRLIYQAVACAVSLIHQFEINMVLDERTRKS